MDEETEPHRSRVAQEPMVVMSRAWDAGSSSFHPAAEGRGSRVTGGSGGRADLPGGRLTS